MTRFPVFQVTEGQWTSQKLIDILSLKIPVNFTPYPQLLCDFITNFEKRPDDLFVVSSVPSQVSESGNVRGEIMISLKLH